jgi:hypothetical protein
MKIPRPGTLVLIFWEDSSVSEGWKTLREAEEESAVGTLCKTAGWITAVLPTCVHIVCCGSFSKDGATIMMSSTMYSIPNSAVRKIIKLAPK